ncbi:ead/Ea22-like family protein, partial [Escherichia coli]
MSEINYQALRDAAVAIETVATPQKLLAFRMKVTPSVVLALLDEIKRLEDTNIDAMCRIAELEAREAELPDGYEPRMGHPINSGERVVM